MGKKTTLFLEGRSFCGSGEVVGGRVGGWWMSRRDALPIISSLHPFISPSFLCPQNTTVSLKYYWLTATGNGKRWHQMQGRGGGFIFVMANPICGWLQFVFLPNIQFRGLTRVCWWRSGSFSVLLQRSDCLMLMISEHLILALASH